MLNCIKHGSFDGSLNLVTVTAVDRAASSEHSSIDCESAKFPSPVRSKNRRCSVVDFSPECLTVHLNSVDQELWLHSSEGHRITESLSNVSMHFVSGMPDDEIHVGRPYGGCCIIWNSKLKCKVSPLPCGNSRVCAIKIDLSDGPLLLINAYMPCDTQVAYHDNQLVFEEVLNDVADLIQISNIDRIVFGGDFNTELSRRASTHTRSLNQFVTNESLSFLSALSCYEVDYTHESDAHGTRSTLDHFIVSSQL
ncbi:hypothetical protein CAPTEDRAFT_210766, partial [Capitella teleta]